MNYIIIAILLLGLLIYINSIPSNPTQNENSNT